jgi:hypothetical protein
MQPRPSYRVTATLTEYRLSGWLQAMPATHVNHPLIQRSDCRGARPANPERSRLERGFAQTILLLAGFLLLLTTDPAEAAADPAGARNLAGSSALPRGDGFARGFAGDLELASHPAVIFADNFEAGGLGERWDSGRDAEGKVLTLIPPELMDGRLGSKILRVTATLGENTGGGLTKWFESADRLFIRFMVRFDEDCDYVHHFCTLRANKGLQGKDRWSGFGGAGLRPNGDERFSTALEPWGNWGRWPAPGQWNFYSYWHEMEASPDRKFWGNAFRPETQPNIRKGEWINAEFMLKHNTPGQADGEQAYWIDGELRGHWLNISWRTSASLEANAFTLESYVTDRWTKHPVNIVDFDNVVIAKDYIGPVASAHQSP